jgi:hypothetical protein
MTNVVKTYICFDSGGKNGLRPKFLPAETFIKTRKAHQANKEMVAAQNIVCSFIYLIDIIFFFSSVK